MDEKRIRELLNKIFIASLEEEGLTTQDMVDISFYWLISTLLNAGVPEKDLRDLLGDLIKKVEVPLVNANKDLKR